MINKTKELFNTLKNTIDKNQRRYNFFVFLSTFARQLIELFIPIILYKAWFSIKNVVLYYFCVSLFSCILAPIVIKIAKKIKYNTILLIWIISFVILQILIAHIYVSIRYLVLIAFLFACYRRCYWITRRLYNLKVIHNTNIWLSYTFISIINQVACMIATYAGALLLDFVNIGTLTCISIILFVISIYPISKIKSHQKKTADRKLNLFWTLKKISISNKYIFGSYELLNFVRFLIPLYLVIYVSNTYQIVWILQVFTWLATILFSYLYGKKINKKNVNYLNLSIFLIVLIYAMKINVTWIFLAIVSFLEWFISKMNEISVNKEFIKLSKWFDYENFNYAYEQTQNIFRLIVSAIMFLFINDLRVMIYFILFVMAVAIPIKLTYKHKNKETVLS
jgi:hypothetical protein